MRHLDQRVEVLRGAVNATRRDQAHQVKRVISPNGLHRSKEDRILPKTSIPDSQVDTRKVLVNDAAGADVQVANLGVALLALRQPDRFTGRRQDLMRPSRPHPIPIRLPPPLNLIPTRIPALTP